MLNFLPVFLLILTIIGLLILRRTQLSTGTKWLTLAVFSLINWGALLVLRTHLPDALIINNWFPISISSDPLTFRMDATVWYLMFALASLLVGIIFTSSAHLQEANLFANWIEVLSLTTVGMLVLLADSVLAFLLVWALIDLVEIIVFTSIDRDQVLDVKTYAIFIGRALGLGFVIWAMVLAGQSQSPLDLSSANGTVLTLLIAGASLRLGILPPHLPYANELNRRRSLGTILRMIAPLSVFAFLARLAVPQAISEWNLLILLFALIACIVGALNWFLANNELEGRPYWLLSFSGMALLSYLHGQSASVVCWGVLMVSVGGWVFLSENHPRKLDYLLPVALLTLSGIPFTPAASGIAGIAAGPFGGLNIFVWLSLAFILAGVIKFSLNKEKPMTHYENWVTLFCSIGMGVLILSAWSGLLFKLQGWNQITYWWAVAAILVILAGIVFLRYSKSGKNWLKNPQADHFYQTLKPFGSLLNQIFHFEWLYKILSFLFDVQKRIVNGLNLILEGEGGILWALVFLALLISLLASGRSG